MTPAGRDKKGGAGIVFKKIVLLAVLLLSLCACREEERYREKTLAHGYGYHTASQPDFSEWCKKNKIEDSLVNGHYWTYKAPEHSSLKVNIGVIVANDIRMMGVWYEGCNILHEDFKANYRPIPKEMTVKWGRYSSDAVYSATLRFDQEAVTQFLIPSDCNSASPVLTILVKVDNEVMVLRTNRYRLSDNLLVFNTAKGRRCLDP